MTYKIRYPLGLLKKRLIETIRSFFIVHFYKNIPNDSLRRLRQLKGKGKGKRCFIVGNGPSLNDSDLSLMKNDYGIVFNGAFDLRDNFSSDKVIHAVEDRLVLEDHYHTINNLPGLVFLPSDLLHLVTSNNPIITEFHRGHPQDRSDWPPYLDAESEYPVFYWGGTVAYYGLQIASWMGFDEVYIIGVDLTYSIPSSVIQKGLVLESTEDDPNHYKATYFGKGLRWHVPNPERMLLAFQRQSKKNTGMKVYNAGVGGNLNCYTRVKYEELF